MYRLLLKYNLAFLAGFNIKTKLYHILCFVYFRLPQPTLIEHLITAAIKAVLYITLVGGLDVAREAVCIVGQQ